MELFVLRLASFLINCLVFTSVGVVSVFLFASSVLYIYHFMNRIVLCVMSDTYINQARCIMIFMIATECFTFNN